MGVCFFSHLSVPLAAPKVLLFGKQQIYLRILSLIRTFACGEGTHAWENANKFAFPLA